ncbi:stage III sporulation protein AA [Tissierella creatinophila]|uniref:AAA+ ATPase domain-containing protein n=1 Tax=Tissierella creatinophila DSM 6911 TaxID=1123403 RepID=A0A1U7M9D9_TISCR|nr:stage III sporulation protein AA [Tissierella creatinophila]OLS03932.1 hypothetical protein TICRE_00590 [Tissierella creatinophila DSM 6911]
MKRKTETFENLCRFITEDIRQTLLRLPKEYKEDIEEIRLRNNKPLNIYIKGKNFFVGKNGTVLESEKEGLIIKDDDIKNTFQLITNHSVYAFSEEIKNGFITITGGHRVGIGGKTVYGLDKIEDITNISSLNFRIAREKKGISDFLIPNLIDENNDFYNTLIISPPQCGKTTLLRDIIRNLSNGKDNEFEGFKIGLIDERSEIAGVYRGVSQNDVGLRTDILDGCLKSHGIIMLIRSMSPEIIAVDEIGGVKDIEAIGEGLRAGIKFIATVHGSSLDEIKCKKNLNEIINEKIFKRYVVLDRSRGVGTIREIINGKSFKKIDLKSDNYGSS